MWGAQRARRCDMSVGLRKENCGTCRDMQRLAPPHAQPPRGPCWSTVIRRINHARVPGSRDPRAASRGRLAWSRLQLRRCVRPGLRIPAQMGRCPARPPAACRRSSSLQRSAGCPSSECGSGGRPAGAPPCTRCGNGELQPLGRLCGLEGDRCMCALDGWTCCPSRSTAGRYECQGEQAWGSDSVVLRTPAHAGTRLTS